MTQNECPASRTRIPAASAVGEKLDFGGGGGGSGLRHMLGVHHGVGRLFLAESTEVAGSKLASGQKKTPDPFDIAFVFSVRRRRHGPVERALEFLAAGADQLVDVFV